MNLKTVVAVLAALNTMPAFAQHSGHTQDHAGHLGSGVMPFDLSRSLHVFSPSPNGGTQLVLSLDADATQIDLIQKHLSMEAAAFTRGDFSDPASIHGEAMPGLAVLRSSAGRIQVRFEPMPQGARLQFETSESALATAVHQWFEAQVRDHGTDAVMHPL